ncbi:MAG: hypothetical protein HLUCCX21_06300, partial [Porphyrobacter sp. HL-46]
RSTKSLAGIIRA